MTATLHRRLLEVRTALLDELERREPLIIVKAPPGSGKTTLITDAAAYCWLRDMRIAVGTQTNAQADDVCRRIAREFPTVPVVRFAGGSASREDSDLPESVGWATKTVQLPPGPVVVVGSIAKWGFIELKDGEVFDYLFVDEAWQMAWADFMLAGRQTAARFLLVGDPGQIPPVVTIDASRWITAPIPPQLAAPEVIAATESFSREPLALPASRRLPYDSVPIVREFYDFDFDAWARPGDRALRPGAPPKRRVGADDAIDALTESSIVALTLATPAAGPPLEEDIEIAELAAGIAGRLVKRGGEILIDGARTKLGPEHIGITATHRVMNQRILQSLPKRLRADVRVDTPERWQGLERPLMIAVHPISGVVRPSAFDLETGRLCVMTSRHQVGVVVVTRDHLGTTLESLTPMADQGVGQADVTGLGHLRHLKFWDHLIAEGRVLQA